MYVILGDINLIDMVICYIPIDSNKPTKNFVFQKMEICMSKLKKPANNPSWPRKNANHIFWYFMIYAYAYAS